MRFERRCTPAVNVRWLKLTPAGAAKYSHTVGKKGEEGGITVYEKDR